MSHKSLALYISHYPTQYQNYNLFFWADEKISTFCFESIDSKVSQMHL